MKKILIASLCCMFLLIACDGKNGSGDNDGVLATDSIDMNFDDMSAFSLVNYGLNMQIMLPKVQSSTGASIEPEVKHDEGDYLWYLSIGPRFTLIIEDFGREKNKLADERKRLNELDDIFNVEFLQDDDKVLMYKRTLHEGSGGKPSYHCYGTTEVDGYTYIFKTDQDGTFKPIVEDMVKTIRSAEPINIDA